MRIGVIGVGLLGSAVASRLLEHGFDVTGYDTRPAQLEALADRGLHATQSVADVAAQAEAIFTVLPTLESVETVVCGAGGLTETARSDTVILQMSTISPNLTKHLYQQVSTHDLHLLDTPISGTSAMVMRGDCTIFVGGDPVQKQRCDPLFEAIGRRSVHIGDIGTASLAKLVTNMLVALNDARALRIAPPWRRQYQRCSRNLLRPEGARSGAARGVRPPTHRHWDNREGTHSSSAPPSRLPFTPPMQRR